MSTLQVIKHGKCFMLPIRHFIVGMMKVKYVLLELHPTGGDTITRIFKTFLLGLFLIMRKNKSVTVESLHLSKWMTLNDKKIILDPNSLITSWLQMWVLESIGNVKVLTPFWNPQCKEISPKLWLPTEIDYVDSPLTCSRTSLKCAMSESWFSKTAKQNLQMKNSLKTFSPLSMFIHVGTWEEEGIRTKKIRIYPSTQQKTTLKKWMGTRRFVYNRVLNKVKNNEEKLNFMNLRNKYVTSKSIQDNEKWMLETPKDIRASAIRDMVKNYNSAFTKLKQRQIPSFKMRYACKKDSPSIEIPKSAVKINNNKIYLYSSYMSSGIKCSSQKLPALEYDLRLQCKYDRWYLIVPYTKKFETTKHSRYSSCALDPGVRTFQTVYSEQQVLKFQQDSKLIKKLQDKIDTFKSLRAKKLIKRKRLTRMQRRVSYRFRCLVDELHYQTCSYLTNTYNHILLPPFESQEMMKKMKVRSVNRNLSQLNHYLFRQRMISKCIERRCLFESITEEYTSKTCGKCGKINNIGSNKIYTCSSCNLIIDRDVNGARNILLKRMTS